MLYLSESIPLAMAEALVHLPNRRHAIAHQLVTIELPDSSPIDSVPVLELTEIVSRLAEDRLVEVPIEMSRKIGDAFAQRGAYLALKVPSVVVAHSFNYLINPRYPRASTVRIQKIEDFRFDARLLRA